MNNIKILVTLLFISGVVKAQTIGDILRQIEQNNTVLASLRQYGEAEKIGNKTGIYPANPEVEYHYLWGNSSNIGNRTDFNATQSFDFPTAYHYKQKISENKNIQIDTKYRIECQKILLEAKRTCIELIYLNIYSSELDKRLQYARQIADAYQSKYDNGEANIIDLNKAKLGLLNIEKQSGILQADRELLKSELIRLNGGNSIDFTSMNYDIDPLPSDFEQWYVLIKDNNLSIRYLQQETELSKKSEKLQRALNLPKFFAGYMSEKVMNEHFQGVTIGISVPLWENKNTVKQIKARTLANQATENDANFRFYNETKALYRKAEKLHQIISGYTKNMIAVNNSELLKKALDTGELSLINYIQELSIYYEAVNNLFETEKEYHLIVAEMRQWEF